MFILFEFPLMLLLIAALGIVGIFAQFTINDILLWVGLFVILFNVIVWLLTFRESLKKSTVFSLVGIVIGIIIIWYGKVVLSTTLVWDFIVNLLFGP